MSRRAPSSLLACDKYRLDVACRDLRDLKGRGPWAVASERSEDATKGPRPFKSRRSLHATSNLFRFARCKFIGR